MARLTRPLWADAASGGLAGLFYYRNSTNYPSVARNRRPGRRKNSACRPQRLAFAAGSAAWRSLSPEDRAVWNALATRPLSGYNLFLHDFLTG